MCLLKPETIKELESFIKFCFLFKKLTLHYLDKKTGLALKTKDNSLKVYFLVIEKKVKMNTNNGNVRQISQYT
jgi:hypothetical protein